VTAGYPITAAALANCLGTDNRTVFDRAFAGDEAFSPASAYYEFPFPTVLGMLPTRAEPIDSGPLRSEDRNLPAARVPLAGARTEPIARGELGCLPTRVARVAGASIDQIAGGARTAVDRWGAARVAYTFASSTGGLEETERSLAPHPGVPAVTPGYSYADHAIDATSAAVMRRLGIAGVCLAVSTACSSSFHALAAAIRLIDRGLADAVVVGSADSLCRTTVFGFHSLGLTAPSATRPFALDRAGITLGEGSAYLVIERDAEASRRAAIARVTGLGAASDAHHHTSPHPDGLGGQLAMRQALDRAGLWPGDIDCVSAHGTGTKLNDAVEAAAVLAVFERAIPLTATKSLTGHTLGSAGLTSLVLAIESLRRQAIPPTLRLDPADAALGVAVVDRPTTHAIDHMMVNAFGFGGSNASVVVSQPGARGI
jgi:3-oxoacyl-[acyl-carrier-protein] synthase-1